MAYAMTDPAEELDLHPRPTPRERPDALGLGEVFRDDRGCPCGWEGYAETGHARQHLRWAEGVPLNAAARLHRVCQRTGPDSLLAVPQSAPAPLRRLAYDLGLLFRRENRYDFPPLPWPSGRAARWKDDPTAYLAVWRDRAIGLVVLHTVPRWGHLERVDAEGRVCFDQPGPARAAAAVFVCGNYRRRGVAGRLVRAACAAERLPIEDVAWELPFSEAGAALAASLVPADRLRVS